MDDTRAQKRAKFLEDQNLIRKRRNRKILGAAAILVAAGVALFSFLNKPYASPTGGNFNIGEAQNYKNQKIEMTAAPLKVENGKAAISLDTLKEKKILYTEYRGEKRKYYGTFDYLPLNAFVTRSGRVVLASSICEPCYGTKFYIEGTDLVCVACGTRWRLDDLMGISGGCVKYAPEEFKYTVENNNIIIDESALKNWKPRYFTGEMQAQSS
ncbi:MAG: DUF2318 domain-containing protein [Firmicutes bacterium]|nr:DUF2318 domain-containing protein [Bacillota bacterium]